MANSPFVKAKKKKKHAKIFVWGSWGTGKTTLALQFPKPVLLDLEGGSDLYGDSFDFDVVSAKGINDIKAAIEWLEGNDHDYETLIIDPITVAWEWIQSEWSDIFLRELRERKNHKGVFFEFGQREWATVKGSMKRLMLRLMALKMNIVVTCRETAEYSNDGKRIVGVKPDGEKTLPHYFDMSLRLYCEKEKKMFSCEKFRTSDPENASNFVGKQLELSYKIIASKLGIGENNDDD